MAILIIYNQILRYISWSTIDLNSPIFLTGSKIFACFKKISDLCGKSHGRKEMDYD